MNSSQATARAGSNIALVKYWGKRDPVLNLPAAGSLSITLEHLNTETTVRPDASLKADSLTLDGQPAETSRISPLLDLLRERAGGGPYLAVESRNNFPTAAGLASSASAFGALVTAADQVLGLKLTPSQRSEFARRGSGSAARSIFGGFAEMAAGERADGSDCIAHPLAEPEHWPLKVLVAVTSRSAKPVSSTDGMNQTMKTSPYYPAWVAGVAADLDEAREAVLGKDFERLADVSEFSALKMHASALAARPGVIYWNAATMDCIHRVRELRAAGHAVFFTVDAGPQLKAVCLPEAAERVARELVTVDGVVEVMHSGLGPGARLLP